MRVQGFVRASILAFVVLVGCGDPSVSPKGTGSEASTGSTSVDASESSEGDAGSSGGASTGVDSSSSGSPDPCGNGTLDPDEVCDGELGLEGLRCVDVGYAAGALACAEDCRAFDESGCSATAICGDGELSEGEVCEDGITTPPSCGNEGSGERTCLDCDWSVASCCSSACTMGCDNACGDDPADLTGTWTIVFLNDVWEGPDPVMMMDLVQDGTDLSGSFTCDAWYIGDHDFEGGMRTGNDIYMHVPMTQLEGGMIMQGTVCGACTMSGVADPSAGVDSDWVGVRG